MAYKSEAQRRKLQELAREGKLHQKVLDAYDKATSGMQIPEKAPPRKPSFRVRKAKKV